MTSGLRIMRSPMRFSKTETAARTAGPMLGEHSRDVLRDYGFGADEIAGLERERAIGPAQEMADVHQ